MLMFEFLFVLSNVTNENSYTVLFLIYAGAKIVNGLF